VFGERMIPFLFVGPFLADLINREIVVPWTVEILSGVEPDMQITRIRLSDKTSRLCLRVRRHLQFLNTQRSL
jgi:hypothetical protein